MTRREQLYSMRGRDLIELCERLGVKYAGTKTSLKESKAAVVDRIMRVEESSSDSVEAPESDSNAEVVETTTEVVKMQETSAEAGSMTNEDVVRIISMLPARYGDKNVSVEPVDWEFGELYDVLIGEKVLVSIAPRDSEVLVSRIVAESVDYADFGAWLDSVLEDVN